MYLSRNLYLLLYLLPLLSELIIDVRYRHLCRKRQSSNILMSYSDYPDDDC